MTTKYWIKLYHEILYDPKMARLPDSLWRRTIEIFLLAGEHGEDGYLPNIDDMCWVLRVDLDSLKDEMEQLKQFGILSCSDGEWYVTKFIERQKALPKSEYMRRKRNTEQKECYYQSVTNSNVDKEEDIDIDIDIKHPTSSSFDPSAERIFSEVTGFTAIPGKNKVDDVHKLRAIMTQHPKDASEYIRKFWDEWLRRKYSKANTGWLDWAITGEIPKWKQDQPVPIDPRSLASEVY